MEQQQSDKKQQKGFITLVSVLIISSVALLVVVSSLTINIENIKAVTSIDSGRRARFLAESCAEIAIDNLKASNTYAGNETKILPFGQCFISTITGTGNTNRSFQSSATYDNHNYRVSVVVQTLNPNTVVTTFDPI